MRTLTVVGGVITLEERRDLCRGCLFTEVRLGPYVYYRVPLRTYLVSRGVFVAVGRRLLVTSGLCGRF